MCAAYQRKVDDVGRVLLWLQRLAVYLKRAGVRAMAAEMRTKKNVFVIDVVRCQLWSDR